MFWYVVKKYIYLIFYDHIKRQRANQADNNVKAQLAL